MRHLVLIAALLGFQDDPIQKLVDQLGAEAFDVRQQAAAELEKLGEKAEPYLRKALGHPDAEVRSRAGQILRRQAPRRHKLLADRLAGKPNAIAAGGGGAGTEGAVRAALGWLARHQNPDGSWSVTGYTKRCVAACAPNPGHEDYDAGVTGLSLLAFLGTGVTPLSKEVHDGIRFGEIVGKGLTWLIRGQDPEGCLGAREAQKYMYSHAIAALALSEAFALTGEDGLKGPAQKAADFLAAAQNPGKGWRYSARSGDSDTSVTLWGTLALRVAWHAGLEVKESAFDAAKVWFDEVTDASYQRVGYTHRGTGKVFIPGQNENFDHHESLTAGAAFERMLLGSPRDDAKVLGARELVVRDLPAWKDNSIDAYYWHFGSLGLYFQDGPDGARWTRWNESLKTALVPQQRPAADGCKAGSWEPVDRWSGEGGRVYTTAINALTLETYYRYKPVPRE